MQEQDHRSLNEKSHNKNNNNNREGGFKACSDCELEKKRDAFSKTQWSRDERRCIECIKAAKSEETNEGAAALKDPVVDFVVELKRGGVDEFLRQNVVSDAKETLIMQGDQACSDRGRPGTCSCLEYVCGEFDESQPRLGLHPHLFLRSMSYVGHYLKEGMSFATPSIVIQVSH